MGSFAFLAHTLMQQNSRRKDRYMDKLRNHTAIKYLCGEFIENNKIDPALYKKYQVKRGLRNDDGTGVVAGITNICNVNGYVFEDGVKKPIPGELIYVAIT